MQSSLAQFFSPEVWQTEAEERDAQQELSDFVTVSSQFTVTKKPAVPKPLQGKGLETAGSVKRRGQDSSDPKS